MESLQGNSKMLFLNAVNSNKKARNNSVSSFSVLENEILSNEFIESLKRIAELNFNELDFKNSR